MKKDMPKDKPDIPEAGRRGVRLDRKIRDRMKEKPRLKYSEALTEILAEEPELRKEYLDEQIAAALDASERDVKNMVQQ